jgi:hypothetical protein
MTRASNAVDVVVNKFYPFHDGGTRKTWTEFIHNHIYRYHERHFADSID